MKIKNILVSQPKPADLEKSPYKNLAKKFNLNIDFHKFITIQDVESKELRKKRISITDYSAVILTSRNAIDHYFRVCKELRVEVPDTTKYFCVSESVAYYLQKYVQYRKRKIFFGKHNFADLLEIIKKHKEERFILPCSDIHKKSISKSLKDNKINFDQVVFYKTVATDISNIAIDKYDIIIFFSPAGVKSLFKNFPEYKQNSTLIAAFGPTTAKAITSSGLSLDIKAPTKTAPSMAMAIEQFLLKKK
ncbi:MAG: uroporphyrinogen-III synthase [Bacteroidales bacterium]|nr:uroporphyrinogen-III synthase [Bacteroidales bacterium]